MSTSVNIPSPVAASEGADDALLPAFPSAGIGEQVDDLARRFVELQRQTQRLQKLASIGTLSAMLAHELKNLLTPIVGYAQYAIQKPEADLMQTALNSALRNAQAAAALCDRILRMADAREPSVTRVPIRAAVEDALGCLGRGVDRDGIRLDVRIDESLAVRFNADDLRQVLFNLILNARQAMLDRPGTLTLAARGADGERVIIDVTDTGGGIRSEDVSHVFEPFFTTRRQGERPDRRGIGLGLTICRQMVESAGGSISVSSRWGEGTTITLDLPAA